MKQLLIRPAELGDATALRKLNREFNAEETPLPWVERQLLARNSVERVLVAVEANEVVGFCCLTIVASCCREKPRAEITELYVAKPHRRKGVARALVTEASRQADNAGVHEFLVLTNKQNSAGRGFYASLGYLEGNDILYRRKSNSASLPHGKSGAK